MDYSLPGCSVQGIFQGGILEWVAISSPRGPFRPRDGAQVYFISCMGKSIFFATVPPGKPKGKGKEDKLGVRD